MRVLSHELASLKNVVSYTVRIRSSLSQKIIYKYTQTLRQFTSLFTKDTLTKELQNLLKIRSCENLGW